MEQRPLVPWRAPIAKFARSAFGATFAFLASVTAWAASRSVRWDRIAMVLRWTLAGLGVAAAIFVHWEVRDLHRRAAISKVSPDVVPFHDATKEALTISLDSARGLNQVALIIAGGLWALYIGKTEETKVDLAPTPQLVLFLACNACFLLSFWSYYAYADRLSSWLASGVKEGEKIEIPDLDNERLRNLAEAQRRSFGIASLFALFTILSGRYLKGAAHASRSAMGPVGHGDGPGVNRHPPGTGSG